MAEWLHQSPSGERRVPLGEVPQVRLEPSGGEPPGHRVPSDEELREELQETGE